MRRSARLPSGELRHDRSRHEFQPSELVHEAYLRMVASERPVLQSPAAVSRVASRIIRNTLVDEARKRRTQKRGGDAEIVFDAEIRPVSPPKNPEEQLAVREVLGRLRKLNPEDGTDCGSALLRGTYCRGNCCGAGYFYKHREM